MGGKVGEKGDTTSEHVCDGRPISRTDGLSECSWQVDQWHLDSVPYVMVILLSDATDMDGVFVFVCV
jgi:hypothetical protein